MPCQYTISLCRKVENQEDCLLPQGQRNLETTGEKCSNWAITAHGPFPLKSRLQKAGPWRTVSIQG